mgnify:FL=1
MKKINILVAFIILFICIALVFFFSYFGINNYKKQQSETLKNENNQVSVLNSIYKDFFNNFKVYDSGNISLDKSCLTNFVTNTNFNDNNIKKLKELERNNIENEFFYTLYLEYDKENSILTLTLKEEHGIVKHSVKYKLYVKGDSIEYETHGNVETFHTTPITN